MSTLIFFKIEKIIDHTVTALNNFKEKINSSKIAPMKAKYMKNIEIFKKLHHKNAGVFFENNCSCVFKNVYDIYDLCKHDDFYMEDTDIIGKDAKIYSADKIYK